MTGMFTARAFVPSHYLPQLAQFSARRSACRGADMAKNELNEHVGNSNNNSIRTHRVVLLRHGQSTWNRDGRHIGWTGETTSIAIRDEVGFDYAACFYMSQRTRCPWACSILLRVYMVICCVVHEACEDSLYYCTCTRAHEVNNTTAAIMSLLLQLSVICDKTKRLHTSECPG